MNIELSKDSKKFLKSQNFKISKRIILRLEKLLENPFPTDMKRVVNVKDKWFRIRVGDYRIEYAVKAGTIFVFNINKRSRIYDRNK